MCDPATCVRADERLACNAVLDSVLVRDLANVAPLALSQQILQGLIVHLHKADLQLIPPAFCFQPLHLIQNLHACGFCVMIISAVTLQLCGTRAQVDHQLSAVQQTNHELRLNPSDGHVVLI